MQVRDERVAEKEAERRSLEPVEVVEQEPPQPPPKKQPVVIEQSDSEEDIDNARVYFVKRTKPTPQPTLPVQPKPDPHAALYAHMFGSL